MQSPPVLRNHRLPWACSLVLLIVGVQRSLASVMIVDDPIFRSIDSVASVGSSGGQFVHFGSNARDQDTRTFNDWTFAGPMSFSANASGSNDDYGSGSASAQQTVEFSLDPGSGSLMEIRFDMTLATASRSPSDPFGHRLVATGGNQSLLAFQVTDEPVEMAATGAFNSGNGSLRITGPGSNLLVDIQVQLGDAPVQINEQVELEPGLYRLNTSSASQKTSTFSIPDASAGFTLNFGGGAPPPADEFIWDNPAGGSFDTADNWQQDAAPQDAEDTAIFNLDSFYTVLFSDEARTGTTQVLDGDVSFLLNGHTFTAVDGPESGLIVDSALSIVGGEVVARTVRIGEFAGSDGPLTIDGGFGGIPTELTAQEGIRIGLGGPGAREVLNGTHVSTSSMKIGEQSPGSVSVDGASGQTASSLQAVDMAVGSDLAPATEGALMVSNGGLVDLSNNLILNNGQITVTGGAPEVASLLQVDGPAAIGQPDGPAATLNVMDGGEASFTNWEISTPAVVNVSGVRNSNGTSQSAVLEFSGGELGGAVLHGELNVNDGGLVTSPSLLLATDTSELTVEGMNGDHRSTAQVDELRIGNTAAVSNGGLVMVNTLRLEGGVLTVRGGTADTPSTVESAMTATIGTFMSLDPLAEPTATLNVLNGGKALLPETFVGPVVPVEPGGVGLGSGAILVSGVRNGQASTLEITGGFFGGALIYGTMTVNDGALVQSPAVLRFEADTSRLTVDGVNGLNRSSVEVNSLSIFNTATVSNGGLVLVDEALSVGEGGTLDFRTGRVVVGAAGPGVDGQLLIRSGGTLSGTGTLVGPDPQVAGSGVNNFAGMVTPGTSAGILTIDGNFTQGLAGTLEMEIAGYMPATEYDQLVITGDAELGGTLALVFLDSFAPRAGDSFALTEVSGTTSGSFDSVNVVNLEPGFQYELTPTAGGMQLTALNDAVYVPEPGTLSLLAAAVVAVTAAGCLRRRRRESAPPEPAGRRATARRCGR